MSGCGGTKTEGAEANFFAMHLLMPDKMLAQEKMVDFADDEQVKALAKKYKVPIGIMVIRLNEFYGKKYNAN